MPIFPSLNTAFVHIPKTGGTSIVDVLLKADKESSTEGAAPAYALTKHESALHIREYCDDSLYNSMFKFSVVRHPWDRLASWYF